MFFAMYTLAAILSLRKTQDTFIKVIDLSFFGKSTRAADLRVLTFSQRDQTALKW